LELLAETLESPIHAFAGGFCGDTQRGGDISMGEASVEAQEDCFAVVLTEGGQGGVEHRLHFLPRLWLAFFGRGVHGDSGMAFAIFAALCPQKIPGLQQGGRVQPPG
jgi:hypothetical protein